MRAWPILWGGVVAIGLFAYFDAQPPSNNESEKPETEVPGWHDLVKDQKFTAEHPQFLEITREIITQAGFECPALTRLWEKGVSAYGTRLEALCGPADGTHGTFPAMHYAVYPQKLKVNLCKEYGAFSEECS